MSKDRPRRSPVLKVAVVVDDLMSGEVHQSAPGPLTVGHEIASDVMVFGPRTPARHRLFDYKGGRYYLDLPPHAKGRVAMGSKAFTVSQLRKRYGSGRSIRVALSPDAKGNLVFGETRVMFQFAAPKPVPPRRPLPAGFRPSWRQIWTPTDISSWAGSLLALGTVFVYSSSLELPPEMEYEVPDRFAQVMGLPDRKEEEPPPEEETKEELAVEDEKIEKKEDKKKPEPEPDKQIKPKKDYSEKALKEARSHGIARVLGTWGGPGEGSVFDVIQSTENNLGELFAQGMTTTEVTDATEVGEMGPGGRGLGAAGDVAANDGLQTGDGPEVEGATKKKKERRVKGKLAQRTNDIFGDVDKRAVTATIRRRMSALKHCYEKALRSKPDLAGKIVYTINISVMGSVTKVSVEDDSVRDSAVTACTTGKIRGWRFPMQGAEEPAEVTFSVTFTGGS